MTTKENTPCPKCGSTDVAGLMQSFFVPLEGDEAKSDWWRGAASETELGEERLCFQCGHEWKV